MPERTGTTRRGDSRRAATGPPVSSRALGGLQLESWRLLWQQLLRDADALAECRVWEERRRRAAPEMLAALRDFLDGVLSLDGLRTAVDRGSRHDWEAFGLRGASGAMFLNRMARQGEADARIAPLLRDVLGAPRDEEDARARLTRFMAGLEAAPEHASHGPPRQPARAAFFASVWWHVQDTERWPVFQPSARRALREEQDVYVPVGEPVADYLSYREASLAVGETLRVSAWELEYLCWWRQQRGATDEQGEIYYEPGASRAPRAVRERPPRQPRPAEVAAGETKAARPRAGASHTQAQWTLARVGRTLGCRVWVAANDHSKSWDGRPLAELSIRRLPSLGLSAASQAVVSLIDVVWLRGANEVAAAFEIEHTTSVYSGLLRLADLAALSPNLSFPMYVVTPRARLDKVRRELSRPSMRALGLHRRCAMISAEALLDSADSIVRWATDPSAIERLATRIDDLPPAARAD